MAKKRTKKDNKTVVEYLLSMGFSPLTKGGDNTIFIRGKALYTISDPTLSVDQIKEEIRTLVGSEDLKEKLEPDADPVEQAETVNPFDGEAEDPFISNSEQVEPFYLCDELKSIETPIFRRLTLDGNRYYYRIMDDGSVKIYASATTLIKDGYVDKSDALSDWKNMMKTLGRDPEEVAQYEADKGTIMHYLYGIYLTGRDIHLHRSFIIKLMEESDLKIGKKNLDRFKSSADDLDNMIERLKRFAKFCSDYRVKVLAIEKILSCEKYEVASPIDAIVQMTITETVEGFFGAVYKRNGDGFKAGDPKKEKKSVDRTFNAILDFKSGYIYPSHAFQLNLYKLMVEEWYGDAVKIDKIFNFSPKSDSSKGYTLRDQTGCKELEKADAVYTQGMINHKHKNKTFTTYKGCLNINNRYDEENYKVTYDIADELSKRFKG